MGILYYFFTMQIIFWIDLEYFNYEQRTLKCEKLLTTQTMTTFHKFPGHVIVKRQISGRPLTTKHALLRVKHVVIV